MMKRFKTTPEAVALMDDLKAAIGRHPDLRADMILAIVAQLVGNLAAFQDERNWTGEQLSELIGLNIRMGNEVAVEHHIGTPRGHA